MDIFEFYNLAMEEGGGFGIWYEYLAKLRIFKFLKNFKIKDVLVFGLPEKYSLGLDTLFFSDLNLEVIDERKEILQKYEKFAKKYNKKVKIKVDKLKNFKAKKKYDLVLSTEVIQNDISLIKNMKKLGKILAIFVPNKKCYAHPYISKLNSLSLNELSKIAKKENLKIIKKGYIDCPPWPAGAELEKNGKGKNESFLIFIIKKILKKITPLLVKFDSFYPTPIKELNSHMVYIILKNETI